MKIKAAIYARYSSDKQRETSIDDQIRRCQELAQRHNLDVPHELVFFDEAMSGTAKDINKRTGYRDLLAAWDAGRFKVLLVDELSRLARDGVELALLQRRLENTPVRLITADGLDTTVPNWELMLGLQGIVSQQNGRDMQHRVTRGMMGQLERGYMVATPAYGYQLDRKLTVDGDRVGTHWRIDEQEAAIVREIFALRRQGASLNAISRTLNERRIPIRRKPRKTAGYWRPGSLANLLKNRIYRGEFVWNDSVNVRSKARKTGRVLTPQYFLRPQLRIIDDATWFDCNNKTHSRTGYGGGKHPLAGLFECGACGSMLTVSSGRTPSLYCAQCTQACCVSAPDALRHKGSVSASGIKEMLLVALRELLSPKVVEAFKDRLRQRLMGGVEEEIAKAQRLHALARQAMERMARVLSSLESDDPVLEAEYRVKQMEYRRLEEAVTELESRHEIFNRAALEKQLSVDPLPLLDKVFDGSQPPEKVRAVLARLFPKLIFRGKTDRATAVFELSYSPGVAAALASDTSTLDDQPLVRLVQLSSSAKRPTEWRMAWL